MYINRFNILVSLPFILIIAACFGTKAVSFEKYIFTPNELRLLYFTPEAYELRLDAKEETRKDGFLSKTYGKVKLIDFRKKSVSQKTVRGAKKTVRKKKAPPATQVSLIIFDKLGSLAIVNDRIVKEGDTVGGMIVKTIEEERVFLKGRQTKWVYLKEKR